MELTPELLLRAAFACVTILALSGPLKRILKSMRNAYKLQNLPGMSLTVLIRLLAVFAVCSGSVPTCRVFTQDRPALPCCWAMPRHVRGLTGTACSQRLRTSTAPSRTCASWTAM